METTLLEDSLVYFIAGGAGVLTLVVLTTVLCCCCRKKKNSPTTEKTEKTATMLEVDQTAQYDSVPSNSPALGGGNPIVNTEEVEEGNPTLDSTRTNGTKEVNARPTSSYLKKVALEGRESLKSIFRPSSMYLKKSRKNRKLSTESHESEGERHVVIGQDGEELEV